ncbi:MAG: hypothetical protein IJE28_04990 [Oscillospiraceae bacterium]|nr:hypothetical protein [Oscillospiraceae bacterium]MBQ3500893.1 hypothetical protein [Oscillospiraceae bacterium]
MKKVVVLVFALLMLCGCGKQDFSIICEPEYSVDNTENFNYIIKNNSDEGMEVTLAVNISQYKDGEWVRLPFSEKYNEVHYNSSMWSEYLSPYSQRLQEFRMCLGDMVDAELTPGKYRLEKEIAFNWYYAEFELR